MIPDALQGNLINRVAIGDFLRRRARSMPDAIALVDYNSGKAQRIGFAQLNDRSSRFTRLFRAAGATKGDRIALMAPNCIDGAAAMYGSFKGGMIHVPLNNAMAPRDLAYVLDHAVPACVIVHPSFWPLWLDVSSQLRCKPRAILLGDRPAPSTDAADHMLPALSGDDILDVEIHDRDPAQIMYTSGTTSRPKGAVHSHLAIVLWTLSMAVAFGLRMGDSHACPLPFFHIGGESHMLTYHHVGGKYVFADFAAEPYLDIIEKERINGLFLLPSMWKALLDVPDIRERDLSSVKRALYAMAPMASSTLSELREIFGCTFDQASGQTETSIVTQFLDGAPSQFPGSNYWGKPISTADQAILGHDGRELPPGEVGEICWRSPTIMTEYYKDEAASSEARQFGWHHSGDLGLIDECGQLLFVDRKKDMIKTGGENVSSIKVEQAILGVPGVKTVAVVGIPHPRWGEAVTAFITARNGLAADTVLGMCRAKLARFEIPKHVEFRDTLPTTATGKILKNELREAFKDLYIQP